MGVNEADPNVGLDTDKDHFVLICHTNGALQSLRNPVAWASEPVRGEVKPIGR